MWVDHPSVIAYSPSRSAARSLADDLCLSNTVPLGVACVLSRLICVTGCTPDHLEERSRRDSRASMWLTRHAPLVANLVFISLEMHCFPRSSGSRFSCSLSHEFRDVVPAWSARVNSLVDLVVHPLDQRVVPAGAAQTPTACERQEVLISAALMRPRIRPRGTPCAGPGPLGDPGRRRAAGSGQGVVGARRGWR